MEEPNGNGEPQPEEQDPGQTVQEGHEPEPEPEEPDPGRVETSDHEGEPDE